jgi:hypothetical protein
MPGMDAWARNAPTQAEETCCCGPIDRQCGPSCKNLSMQLAHYFAEPTRAVTLEEIHEMDLFRPPS